MEQEEIIKHLHEALNSVDITFPYRYVLVEAIEALSQPSLPSNLDEAADAYVGNHPEIDEGVYTYAKRLAFKAGAEWMAAQGVNHELEVKADAGGYPYIDKTFELYDYTEDKPIFNPGDIVIVNIRKKEDKK